MKQKSVKVNGTKYYEYVLLYVNDLLLVSEKVESVIQMEIDKYFELKKVSIDMPDIYLGGKLSRIELDNGVMAYTFSSNQNVKSAEQC